MKTQNMLRRLMRACIDDERTLLHEREVVDARRAKALTQLARERETFVEELERAGSQRRPSGSPAEWLRARARMLWVLAAGRNNGDAIAMCRHSRARTEARYERAIREPWPDAMLRVLAAQHRRLAEDAHVLGDLYV